MVYQRGMNDVRHLQLKVFSQNRYDQEAETIHKS